MYHSFYDSSSGSESFYYDEDPDEDAGMQQYLNEEFIPLFDHSVRRNSRNSSEKLSETVQPAKRLLPLKELCCRFAGQNVPFEAVQHYPSRVPEDIQRRIAFWSFPTDEKKLLELAKFTGGVTDSDISSAKSARVQDMIQTGEIDGADDTLVAS